MFENRFAGVLSDEYEQVRIIIPHYEEHQDTVREAVAAHAANSQKKVLRVVDIGCGTGLTSERLLNADPRIEVLAIDNEPSMVRQARERLAAFGERVIFRERDALQKLRELSMRSFDIIVSACTIHNLPPSYRQRLMQEIGRILVPSGLYVNADKFGFDDPAEHARELERQLKFIRALDEQGRRDLYEAWYAHYLEDEAISFTESEQIQLLRKSGFRLIRRVYRECLEATVTAVKN